MTVSDAERRALEQVRAAGRKGLAVDRGWESTTQARLVERGLLWQEIYQGRWLFTLSPQGEQAIEDRE